MFAVYAQGHSAPTTRCPDSASGERPEPEVPDGLDHGDRQGGLDQPPRRVEPARRGAAARSGCR